MNMTQLYKKIGFLMMFLMMSAGVKGQAPAIYTNQNLCISPSIGLTIQVPQKIFDRTILDGCSSNRDLSRYITNYNVRWEYSLNNGISFFPINGYVITSTINPDFDECCANNIFSGCADLTQKWTSTTIETLTVSGRSVNIPYLPINNITTSKQIQIRISSSPISPAYGMGAKYQTYVYTIFPPSPIASNITKTESCATIGGIANPTGAISFDATAYTNAKVYLTKGCPLPTRFTPDTNCSDTNAFYPFCFGTPPTSGNGGTTSCPNTVMPASVIPQSNSGLTGNSMSGGVVSGISYINLEPGIYYISVVNVVSDPFLTSCFYSQQVIINTIPQLKGHYYVPPPPPPPPNCPDPNDIRCPCDPLIGGINCPCDPAIDPNCARLNNTGNINRAVTFSRMPTAATPTPAMGWFTINTDEVSYRNLANTTSNLHTATVWVDSNVAGNSQFISEFTNPTNCSDNDGTVTIQGEGGKVAPTITLERKYMPKTPNAVLTTEIITVATATIFTVAPTTILPTNTLTIVAGGSVAMPKYLWGGVLTGLSYGEYKITITDASANGGCDQTLINVFNIRETIRVEALNPANLAMLANDNTAAFKVTNPTCISTTGSSLGMAEIAIKVNKYHYNNGNFNLAGANIGWDISRVDLPNTQPITPIPTSFDYEYITVNGATTTNLGNGGTALFVENDNAFVASGALGSANTNTIIRFKNLPPGDYTFSIGMHNGAVGICNPIRSSNLVKTTYYFRVSPRSPLNITRTPSGAEDISVTNLLCNSVNTGVISLKGTGNEVSSLLVPAPLARYSYFLLKEVNGNYVSTATLAQEDITVACNFVGLSAGTYKVQIKRGNDAACDDMYPTDPIIITQPLPVTFPNLVKLNISCNGVTTADGSISTTISGGTQGTTFSYKYQLQPFVNGVYLETEPTISITNGTSFTTRLLDVGTYRIKIIDGAGCATYLMQNGSQDFVISMPDLLAFGNVAFTNMRCFGEDATISPSVTGGTPFATGAPYEFYYNLNGSTTRVPFTATTSLAPGSYTIWVKDSRGCELAYTGVGSPFVVRPAVPSALAVVTDVPLVNGFAITCFGGDNGKIKISTTGGVPFTTGGQYSYQLNNDMPIISSLPTYEFSGLFAGTYVVKIKDSYGCELVRTFVLNESTAIISLVSTNVVPTVCPNDLTGKITVQPSGGAGVGVGTGYQVAYRRKVVAPATAFVYSAFVSVSSATNLYEIIGLRAGTYEIIVKDGNDCSTITTPLEVVVPSIKPIIEITSVIEQVKCFGESNGSINITPAAGFVVNGYQWTNRPETTNTLTGLAVGNYEVEITYSGGCKEKFSFTITQPDVLVATSASTIACDRLNDGKITLNATGGTLPYSYSINNGVSWIAANTTSKIFENLAPNVYKAKVRDAKNCLVSLADITIRERGDNPQPRFLVATRQNALDTLVLINTSYPEPTNTVWTLDPQAEVISQNKDEVRVKFPAAGNYSVAMNSTFNGCSYLITKNLVISNFDPNDPGMVVGLRPITSAVIVPNPNNGAFTLNVVLTKKQYVKLVVIDAMGNIRYEQNRNADRTLGFSESIILPTDLLDGLYILRVLTDNDAQEVRFTITR